MGTSVHDVALAILVVDAFSIIVVGLAAIGALKRNRIVGLRYREVMRDDTTWRSGHRAGLFPLTIWMVFSGGFGIAAMLLSAMNYPLAAAFVVFEIAGLIVGVLWATRRARSAAIRGH